MIRFPCLDFTGSTHNTLILMIVKGILNMLLVNLSCLVRYLIHFKTKDEIMFCVGSHQAGLVVYIGQLMADEGKIYKQELLMKTCVSEKEEK